MTSTSQFTASNLSDATPELSEAAIIWCRGGDKALTAYLVAHAPDICPACGDPCALTDQGVCLGCLIEWDEQITQAEARYDAEHGADLYCGCGAD